MALVDALADYLTTALDTPGATRAASSSTSSGPAFADAAGDQPLATPATGDATKYIVIQDVKHPWVFAYWPQGWALPPNYIVAVGVSSLQQQGGVPRLAAGDIQLDTASTALAPFTRQPAQDSWLSAFPRRLRDEPLTAEQLARAQKRAALVVPGAALPRVPRAPRKPRPPRAARPPRAPRAPRQRRVPGTKGARPPRPCRHRNSLGQCVDGVKCIPGASIPEPNVGHSSCNWGPVDSCGNCVTPGCDSKAFSLLKPLLNLLPVRWTQESVAAANAPRQVPNAPAGSALSKIKLPPIGAGGIQGGQIAYPVDKRALVAGCACQSWPWWVICPNCSGSPKCTCPGECIPFPASSANCGG